MLQDDVLSGIWSGRCRAPLEEEVVGRKICSQQEHPESCFLPACSGVDPPLFNSSRVDPSPFL